MRTTCNPGRLLEVEGSFVLVPGLLAGHPVVVDRASNLQLHLHGLLEQFLEDPVGGDHRADPDPDRGGLVRRVGDIVAGETRSELIARGYSDQDATEAIAFGVFLRRTEAMVEPVAADHDYARDAIAGRAYLEQVAPEELDR